MCKTEPLPEEHGPLARPVIARSSTECGYNLRPALRHVSALGFWLPAENKNVQSAAGATMGEPERQGRPFY